MDPTNPLAPIFAASLAVQQVLEVLSVPVEKWFGEFRVKAILGVIGFFLGLILALVFNLNVMSYFGVPNASGALDKIVTALILSAGTEGMNSIVKFLKYLKEDKKATAAETLQALQNRAAGAETPAALPGASGAKGTLEKLRSAAARKATGKPATPAGVPKTPVFTFISQQ